MDSAFLTPAEKSRRIFAFAVDTQNSGLPGKAA
jgi:hypothetical protein